MSKCRATLVCLSLLPMLALACSGGAGTGEGTGGASSGSGGASSGTGGGSDGSGGSLGTGGVVGSGGTTAGTGGEVGTGGVVGTGGAATGGESGSGGSPGTGGAASGTGGASGGAGGTATGTGGRGTGGRGTGGTTGSGGTIGTGGGGAGTGGATGTGGASTGGAGGASSTHFSFFVTSLGTMRTLSGSQNGFGGDLRHGESSGLAGADKICTETAESSMPGNGKTWRAFLSVTSSAPGGAVNAIDRVGEGPWYDRMGRIVAMNKAALMNARPQGADSTILNDLPNELGIPNHQDGAPGCSGNACPDNHHVLTGASTSGGLYGATATCSNWSSTATTAGRPRVGFSWIAGSRTNWMSGQDEGGCGAGVNVMETGGSDPSNPIVGSGGGYGAIYCFALTP